MFGSHHFHLHNDDFTHVSKIVRPLKCLTSHLHDIHVVDTYEHALTFLASQNRQQHLRVWPLARLKSFETDSAQVLETIRREEGLSQDDLVDPLTLLETPQHCTKILQRMCVASTLYNIIIQTQAGSVGGFSLRAITSHLSLFNDTADPQCARISDLRSPLFTVLCRTFDGHRHKPGELVLETSAEPCKGKGRGSRERSSRTLETKQVTERLQSVENAQHSVRKQLGLPQNENIHNDTMSQKKVLRRLQPAFHL